MNITVVIVSKNDQDVIADAIKSCSGFGEVLVIDSNQDDLTKKICNKLNVRHIAHPFKDFADQRNFGLYHVTTPWIFYLDSDERLTEDFKKEAILNIKNHNPNGNVAGFFINRKTFFYGKDWHFQDKVQRLFYKDKLIEWQGVVHETPKVNGEFSHIKSPILHFTHRNLSQMIAKTNEWSQFEADLRLKNNHPKLAPWRFGRVMFGEFIRSYVGNRGYKMGTYGFIEAIYQSFSIFITYAKLWEMQQKMRG